jgi:hypothetical protein
MTTLDKQLKHDMTVAYNKWFNRWYAHAKIESLLKSSAQQGFTAETVYDRINHESDQYSRRRFEDEHFVKLLQQRLPDLKIESKEWTENWTNILGQHRSKHRYTVTISGWA